MDGGPYSLDLRERVVRSGGRVAYRAIQAQPVGLAISTAIKLGSGRFRETGSVEPDQVGG